jgi:hypothetical protein
MFGLVPRFAGLGPLVCAWGFRRRLGSQTRRIVFGVPSWPETEETDHRRTGIVGTQGDGFENLAGGIRWWAVWSSFRPLPGRVRGEGYRSLP